MGRETITCRKYVSMRVYQQKSPYTDSLTTASFLFAVRIFAGFGRLLAVSIHNAIGCFNSAMAIRFGEESYRNQSMDVCLIRRRRLTLERVDALVPAHDAIQLLYHSSNRIQIIDNVQHGETVRKVQQIGR